MTPTEFRSARTALVWTSAVLVVAGLAFAGFVLYVRFVAQPQAGDVPSGVSCDQLPSLADVEHALERQALLVERLEELGDVTVLPRSCGNEPHSGAEIVVLVPSKKLSDDVRDVLEADPFTVPVSIRNV